MDIELPSGENNVKFWTIDTTHPTQSVLEEIFQWVNADSNNWAVLNDTHSNDIFIFNSVNNDSVPTAIFFGKKRMSEAYLSEQWYFTKAWEQELRITYYNWWYALTVRESIDDYTHTNYLSAQPVGYDAEHAFMPTQDYQPATKKYVDSAIVWWWIPYQAGNWISIANHVISNIWVISGDSWTVYTVKVSSSAPVAWTPNTTITFKTS